MDRLVGSRLVDRLSNWTLGEGGGKSDDIDK